MQGPVEESGHEVLDITVCDICADAGRVDLLAKCSRCSDGAEHTYCMLIMVDKVPSGDWLCEDCEFGVQTKGRKTDDFEASPKRLSFGQASSGSNSRKKKSLAKVSDDENRVGSGSTSKILGKRQSEGFPTGSMLPPFNRSSDMQGDRGISAGSLGCPASETGTPELTSLSSGGRVLHPEEKGPRESQPNRIPDLNSPLVGDDFTFSSEGLLFPVAEGDERSTPNLSSPLAGGDVTFTGEWLFFSFADEKVKRSGESSAPHLEISSSAGKDELNLNLEAPEAAATKESKGGEDEISLSLSLSSQTATKGREDGLDLSLGLI